MTPYTRDTVKTALAIINLQGNCWTISCIPCPFHGTGICTGFYADNLLLHKEYIANCPDPTLLMEVML